MSQNITEDQIYAMSLVLNKLPMVTWDRYAGTDGNYVAYGWIEREQDNYKDFVVIDFVFNDDETWSYNFCTSSAKYSEQIHNLLEMTGEHSPCVRIEATFDDVKAVRLK